MQRLNLLAPLATQPPDEVTHELLQGGPFCLKKIVSTGQATPPGEWYDQETDEWVLLLAGAAELRFEDEASPCVLQPGDAIQIAAHRRHRVAWTDPNQETIWLTLHYQASRA